ncbi:hypothetical protein GQ53DRAFT_798583 [Thozetella sp. PMI_491]|nr:hypothetical protein GQ53DRAFT_798583 [Thozetella sp. PMI_491]
MASSEILSQTLSSITGIKLEQLRQQKTQYELKKRALLEDLATETDPRKRVKAFLEGMEKLPTMKANPLISGFNLKRFVEQAEYDPLVSDHFMQDYEATLRNSLEVQSNKYDFASLYGRLVNEWIAAGKTDDAASDGGFIPVGREEMQEQRATWEEYVFKPKETDGASIRDYLDRIFTKDSKDVKRSLEPLLKSVKDLQEGWDKETHFNEAVLTSCINGMLRSDLLNDQKRATVRDFLGNKIVLSEIADVLNMRMATRSSWRWNSPLVIEQRRNLNGRYRFYPDEDILDSMFIHYIGQRWAVHFRSQLMQFAWREGVWKRDTPAITKEDARRRRFFLGENGRDLSGDMSVRHHRDQYFKSDILLDQLPSSMHEVRGGYGDNGTDEAEDSRKSHLEVTQDLLRRIQTEVLMQTKLGRDITVIRSDFKWFGPSIPHSSLYAVLEFFGVSAEWIDFFRRVLEAPLRFAQDPIDAEPQLRRRGTPLSTPLADFLGEVLLFCVDFAVNQRADGVKLYRLHDDMWVYGSVDACTKAWAAMAEFTELVGLEFNKGKTGAAWIQSGGGAGKLPGKLPKGDVTWGFLKLDPATGRFLIDQAEVDKHIEELRLQLDACKSVFDWTQAWNIYGARFFANNFGHPAHCYGFRHVESMLQTFQRIQQRLFPESPGGASEHLKRMIAERFGVSDIPDGYLFYPLQLGGLGLQNPFVQLYLISRQFESEPAKAIAEYLEHEEDSYRKAKERFEKQEHDARNRGGSGAEFSDLLGERFMGFDEFVRYRESLSRKLGDAYLALQGKPDPLDVEFRGEVKAALQDEYEWYDMTSYDKWIVQLFSKDMITRFGGLNIVDKGLLPTGLMAMLRQSRFQWQG